VSDLTVRWLPIPGRESYQVSESGQVRSHRRDPHGRLMRLSPQSNGYMTVVLGRGYKFYVHRLVALAFIGPCPEGQEVRHHDGDRSHNAAANLLYGTRSDNMQDAVHHGTVRNQNMDKPACDSGHPYTAESTYVYPNGYRCCKICRRTRQRRPQ
jgi:hypothetical protein